MMNYETKWDVFEGLLESYMYSADMVIDEISTDGVADRLSLGNIIASTRARYANALPDHMPVIPEAVGEWIIWCKGKGGIGNVSDAIRYSCRAISEWIYDERNSDTFARAWVLDVWRVEETGEIVKLEVEK